MRSERLGEGVSAGGDAVSGNHLPNPLPPRVRRHSSTAQTPAKRVRRSREHARGGSVWQCRLRSTSSSCERRTALGDQRAGERHRPRAGVAELPHRTLRTEAQPPGRHGGAMPGNDAAAVFGCSPVPVARVVFGTSAAPAAGTPTDRIPPSVPVPPFLSRPAGSRPAHLATGGVRAQSHRRGRAPVKRRIQACATIYFQPTSHPCPYLGELADQPPCHQARRDQAVRFHPTGTGHECEAHFPARLLSETLRDRMLPAKLPCRHSAGWSTCHVGTAGRSRFDLGCRRLGTRARPRGNVQERQARKDQGDANTEGGLAS